MNRIKLAIAIDQAMVWSYNSWAHGYHYGPQVRFWNTEVRKAARA